MATESDIWICFYKEPPWTFSATGPSPVVSPSLRLPWTWAPGPWYFFRASFSGLTSGWVSSWYRWAGVVWEAACGGPSRMSQNTLMAVGGLF